MHASAPPRNRIARLAAEAGGPALRAPGRAETLAALRAEFRRLLAGPSQIHAAETTCVPPAAPRGRAAQSADAIPSPQALSRRRRHRSSHCLLRRFHRGFGPEIRASGRSGASSPVRGSTPYATRDDAMQFADDMAARRGLDREWVRATIGSARFLPNVPRLMLPGPVGTVKNWRVYRSRFIDPVRIEAGVRFWRRTSHAGARRKSVRRARRDHRRHHRRGNHLRPRHGQLPRDRCPHHAGLRLPATTRARPSAANSSRRDRAVPDPAKPPRRPLRCARQLCRRHGHAAVHALQLVKYAVDFDGDGRVDLWNSPPT
jgi:hypothetical protein